MNLPLRVSHSICIWRASGIYLCLASGASETEGDGDNPSYLRVMKWFNDGYVNGRDIAGEVMKLNSAEGSDVSMVPSATQGDPGKVTPEDVKKALIRLSQSSSNPGTAIVREVVDSRFPELVKNLERLVEDCDRRIQAMMSDICSLAPSIERQNNTYSQILHTIRDDLKDVSSSFTILESNTYHRTS